MTPFCCKECGAVIGQQEGHTLTVGNVMIVDAVKFRHDIKSGGCGIMNRWHPDRRPLPPVKVRNAPQSSGLEAAIVGDFN